MFRLLFAAVLSMLVTTAHAGVIRIAAVSSADKCGSDTIVIPHLTFENDATGTMFTSALIVKDWGDPASVTSNPVWTFCGFSETGQFLGGRSLVVTGGTRLFSTTADGPAGMSIPGLMGMTAQSLAGKSISMRISVANGSSSYYNSRADVQFGYVGNNSQMLVFAPAPANTSSWTRAHLGSTSLFNTTLIMADARSYYYSNTPALNCVLTFTDDEGNKLLVHKYSIPVRGKATIALNKLINQFTAVSNSCNEGYSSSSYISTMVVIDYPSDATGGRSYTVESIR